MNVQIRLVLFGLYSHVINIMYMFLELLPIFMRNVVFRLLLRELGKNCLIDYHTYFRYPSRIRIGDNVTINRGCSLYASYMVDGAEIRIGNNVALSPHVRIYAASHDYSSLALNDTGAAVIIEDFAWVGAGTTILPGVTIGRGAVVGAASVVSRNVPPYSVAVGNPARVIKERTLLEKA